MRSCIRRGKVLEVHAKHQLADSLRSKLQHVRIHIPSLVALIKFVKNLERILNSLLHGRSIVSHGLGTKSWRQKLVYLFPLFCISVTKENTSLLVLDGEQRVTFDDALGEKVCLAENNVGQLGIICV